MNKKKISAFISALLILICLSSCEMVFNKKYKAAGKVWFVGFGADYKQNPYGSDDRGMIDPLTGKKLNTLRGTVNDAIELGNAFKAIAESLGVEYEEIYFISDTGKSLRELEHVYDCKWSTYQQVLSEELNASENDIIIFTFSGHGDGNSSKDSKYDSSDRMIESQMFFYGEDDNKYLQRVSYSEVYNFIDLNFKGAKFILCDVCYSGSLIHGDGVTVNKDVYPTENQAKLLKQGNKIDQSSKIWVLSACTYYQQAYEEPNMEMYKPLHGQFTQTVLDGLGWNEKTHKLGLIKAKDGNMLTAGSISRYVRSHCQNLQTPVFSAGSADLVLFRF